MKLEFDPYAYVRTAVMRSLLYKKQDYDKLLKMGFSEIAKFLQESKYHAQINALGLQYKGAELLERALDQNIMEDYQKLRRICSEGLAQVVDEYVLRRDIWNLKTLLRGRFAKISEEQIFAMLVPAGRLREEQLRALLKKEDVAGILQMLPIVDEHLRRQLIEEFARSKNLLTVENLLDRFYYTRMLAFAKGLPSEGEQISRLLRAEIDVLNILTVLRAKKEGAIVDEHLLLGEGLCLDSLMLHRLIHARTIEDALGIVRRTEYGRSLGALKSSSLVDAETALLHQLVKLSVSVMHKDPLSPNVIIGYMFLKENEIRNLRILVKGKQLKVDNAFMQAQLVYAV